MPRSPIARGLDGRNLEAAAQLVGDKRGEHFALDVFGDDKKRLAALHHRIEQGQELVEGRQLFFVDENIGLIQLDPHLIGVGHEIGRDVAAVELHALDHLKHGLRAILPSSTVIMPSLPTCRIARARKPPISTSPFAEIVPIWAISSFRVTALRVLLQVGNDGLDRSVDAAFQIHRIRAGGNQLGAFRTIACASTVAVVVPSPAR